MDPQIKKGILDACVLAELQSGEAYGYQLLKDISVVIDISESTLYPILRRLEKASCLTSHSVAFDGRLRKYYRITEEGRDKLAKFREEWQAVADVIEFIRRKC